MSCVDEITRQGWLRILRLENMDFQVDVLWGSLLKFNFFHNLLFFNVYDQTCCQEKSIESRIRVHISWRTYLRGEGSIGITDTQYSINHTLRSIWSHFSARSPRIYQSPFQFSSFKILLELWFKLNPYVFIWLHLSLLSS